MTIASTSRRTRGAIVGMAVFAAVGIGTALTGGTAHAATQNPNASTAAPKVQRLCSTPAKGYLSCYALKQVNPVEPASHPGQLGLPQRDPQRLRPLEPAVGLRTAVQHAPVAARPSPSSTPRTTRTPNPTSRPTAPSTGCRPAPRPTAASGRSTRTARPRRCRPPTPAGPARSPSTSTWCRPSARTATSCWSRRRQPPRPTSVPAVNTAVALGAKFVSNSYGGSEDGSENTYDSSLLQPPGRGHHRQLR